MSGVFVLKGPNDLVELKAAHFSDENTFQSLLADFPALLSGDLIDSQSPRRWVLISREISVPDSEAGGGRWSVDHLFIDQDAVPTIVEVKRQTDTRLRREVIGQMLEYAANAIVYWPIDRLIADFSQTCAGRSVDPDECLRTSLGLTEDVSTFWERAETNLREGQIRLLFVADKIPDELKRIVEFLNEQMDKTEVLALELRQFEGEGLKTLVPVVYGQTEDAKRKKESGVSILWTEALLLQTIRERHGEEIYATALLVLDWMKKNSRVWYGRGKREGSARSSFNVGDREINPVNLWTYGKIEIAFPAFRLTPLDASQEFLSKLNEVAGVSLPPDSAGRYPSIPLRLLVSELERSKFFKALDWMTQRLRSLQV